MIEQIVQIAGSLMILTAFTLLQLQKTTPTAWVYLTLNAIGAMILAVNAFLNQA